MNIDKQTAEKLNAGSLADCVTSCRNILQALEYKTNRNATVFQAQTLLHVLKTRVIREFKLREEDLSGIPDFEILEIAQAGLDSYDKGADDSSKTKA
jgi:hypothetical protein